MKRAALTDNFIQSALHLIVALGITSFLNVSAGADFTDANWLSMGGIPGANGLVRAAAVDSSGNLYIGGEFTILGGLFAKNVANWKESSLTPLGSVVARGVEAVALH